MENDNVVADELAAARAEIKRIGDELTSTIIKLVTAEHVSNTRRLKILEMEKEIERERKKLIEFLEAQSGLLERSLRREEKIEELERELSETGHRKHMEEARVEIERLKKLKDAPEMFDRYLDSIASILGRFQTIIDEVVSERGQI